MSIRQVRKKSDLNKIQKALSLLNIDYATPQHAQNDFRNNEIRLYALIENDCPVAICSVVPDHTYNYLAIKRLVVLDTNNRGKGYAKKLISTVVKRQKERCGCTPWADNKPMQRLLKELGFVYQYTFNEVWTFWKQKQLRSQLYLRLLKSKLKENRY